MTTQPGPPIDVAHADDADRRCPGLPGIPIPDIPIPGLPRNTDVPDGARTAERADHDMPASSRASTRPPGWPSSARSSPQENNPLGPNGESVGQMLAEAACQFLPQAHGQRGPDGYAAAVSG